MGLSYFLESIYLNDRLDITEGASHQLRVAVRLLNRFAGPVALNGLSKALLVDWMRALGEGRSAATVNGRRSSVLSIWNYAAELAYCDLPPRIPKRREPQRLPVVWTIEQVGQILGACAQVPGVWLGVPVSLAWRLAVLVCWDTACRIGSLLAAKVQDVDLCAGTWQVPAESMKGRRADRLYRLHPDTIDTISRTLPSARTRLFPYPFAPRQVFSSYARLLRLAGLPADRQHLFHCLRRSSESYAAQARGIEFAAAAVGHGVDVARRSYVSPVLCPGPSLIDAIPRPTF